MSLGEEMGRRLLGTEPDRSCAAWVRDRAGEHLWSKQVEIAESVDRNRRTAVKSSVATGKSHIASRLVGWWLDRAPLGEAFVVTSAPTATLVRAILWRYISQMHKSAGLAGRVTQTEWKIGSELVAFGRKPADYDETSIGGIHAAQVLVILDEASGVPSSIWDSAESITTGEACRILAIGNPDDPASRFAEVCRDDSGWNVITVSAFDTPAFTGERVPHEVSRNLVARSWVEEKRLDWGEDSPLWSSRIEGQFPTQSNDQVIRASALAQCRLVELSDDGVVQLGVDCGAGGDHSVIRERRGPVAGRVWRSQHADPKRLVREIVDAIDEAGATVVNIDGAGIGWGIVGWVKETLTALDRRGVEVYGTNTGTAATRPSEFVNLKAEMWWDIGRRGSEDKAWDLRAIDDRTAADLLTCKWALDTRGRVKVESKDDVRKRLGRSPDDADALLLAYHAPMKVTAVVKPARDKRRSIMGGAPGLAKAPR